MNWRQLAVAAVGGIALVANAADQGEHGHDSKTSMKGPSMQMHMSMMKGMKEMQSMKPTGNMDRDFAVMMRHHHQQGVQMAQMQLEHGKDPKMREMAQKMIDTQQKEIADFDQWLKSSGAAGGKK